MSTALYHRLPGKRTKLLQSCAILCDPMDCSPSGTSVHGILQARILEWVAISSCRGSSRPRDWTRVSYFSCVGRWVLYLCKEGWWDRTQGLLTLWPKIKFSIGYGFLMETQAIHIQDGWCGKVKNECKNLPSFEKEKIKVKSALL